MKYKKGSPDDGINIRPMSESDIAMIAIDHCPPWSTVQETKERWSKYYHEQQENIRTVGVIEQGQEILGYGSLFLKSSYPHFSNVPEINDVWIYEEYRSRGLGTKLINWLEELAKKKGYKEIGIGFGLYADYGAAQKLYFRLGYAPDGHGVTYKYQPTIPGESYPLDDELILWLKKDLSIGGNK
jgi:GNAT superfamily N-acetyltransferase